MRSKSASKVGSKLWCQRALHIVAHNVARANGCSGYVEYSKFVQSMLFSGYLILRLQFRGVVKPSSSLLPCIPNQNSSMPPEFLLDSRFEKTQTFENMFFSFSLLLQNALKMLSSWFYELRCFGRKHVLLLHFVSGKPDSDPPETPEKEVGSKVSVANHMLKEFAS